MCNVSSVRIAVNLPNYPATQTTPPKTDRSMTHHSHVEASISEVHVRVAFKIDDTPRTDVIHKRYVLLTYARVSHEHDVVGLLPVGVGFHATLRLAAERG